MSDLAKSLGIASWIATRKCPKDLYYQAIHDLIPVAKKLWDREDPDGDPDDDTIARAFVPLLEKEGGFETYVLSLSNAPEIPDAETWHRMLYAAALMLVRSYRRAIANGKWSP